VTLPVAAVHALVSTTASEAEASALANVRQLAAPLARARPVWDAERVERVCVSLREAMPLALATRVEGHEPETLLDLCERDPDVRSQVSAARAEGQMLLIRRMQSDPTGKTTNACTWLLERLAPKDFRPPPQTVETTHTGPAGSNIAITLSAGDVRQLAKGKP
jgi:hypothetical protein